MTSDRWNQIKAVLDEVAACDPASRDYVLRERFASDSNLRHDLETLLTLGADAPPRETSATQATTIAVSPTISPALDDTYGPYVPLRKLGEGGMGTVYLARQAQPIAREVALKVVKLGMDSRQVLERFEAERRTLALMEHPHVARVLDAGASLRGRPYFVMEFVNGAPIDRYCDRNTLGVRDRLKLFVPVCAAIQHAHQKGVIHRDIKPSNILITDIDGSPLPKVIDFGVARATNSGAAECGGFTVIGQIIGTPEYMSPEQADLGALDIDTTSDIYSLGIVLYELLVGALPLDRGSLRNAPFSEVIRTIRETPIPRPTARIAHLGAAAEEVARKRSSDPERLKRELSGDLEWVLMKALEKDRGRRYASASEFAADIERALKNEPVTAGPPGAAYRLRKFVARHRLGIVTAAAFLALLIAAVVISATQAIRANRERERAVAASREAEAEKLAAYAMGSLSQDPERSAILAMYAIEATLPFHLGVRPSAENALHRALLSMRAELTFRGHRSSVYRVMFSPDGARLLTASRDGAAKLWDTLTGKELATLAASAQLNDAVFSPDGGRIATVDESGIVKIWDAPTRREVRVFRHPAHVRLVLFGAPNRIATVCVDRTVRVWDVEFGHELFTLQGQVFASFSPDRRRLLTVGVEGSAFVWDASTGRRLIRLVSSPIAHAAYSPDGASLATASPSGAVKLWNAADGRQKALLEGCAGAAVVIFSPDGRRLAAGASDHKSLTVCDTATGKQISMIRSGKAPLQRAIFSPGGEWIATTDLDSTARLWNASTGEELSPFIYKSIQVNDVAFSPDGRHVATADTAPTAHLWDLRAPRELLYLDVPSAQSAAFSPDGRLIAIAASDKTAKLVDAASGRLLLTLRGHEDGLTSVAFSPDGLRLLTASIDGTAKVWDAASGAETLALRGRQVVVWKAVFSPDGRRIATAGTDQTAKIWDVSTGRELLSIRGSGRVMDVAFSPDGQMLATGGDEKSVNIWDAASGRLLRRIEDLAKPSAFAANWIAFSPDGKRIVTTGGNPVLWDIATGGQLLTLRGHGKAITAIAFSPDGKRVATGSRDQSAAIWNAETGQQLFAFQHESPVSDVAFTNDGRRLATADASGVQVYALGVEDLTRLARSRITRPLTPAECRNFFQSDACPSLP